MTKARINREARLKLIRQAAERERWRSMSAREVIDECKLTLERMNRRLADHAATLRTRRP